MDINTVTIDLNEVEAFIEDPNFHRFLLDNTTDFAVAAFILQTLMERVREYREAN